MGKDLQHRLPSIPHQKLTLHFFVNLIEGLKKTLYILVWACFALSASWTCVEINSISRHLRHSERNMLLVSECLFSVLKQLKTPRMTESSKLDHSVNWSTHTKLSNFLLNICGRIRSRSAPFIFETIWFARREWTKMPFDRIRRARKSVKTKCCNDGDIKCCTSTINLYICELWFYTMFMLNKGYQWTM